MKVDSHASWLVQFFTKQIGPGKRFSSRVEMAKFLGLPPTKATKLFNFLKGADTQYKAVIDWFEQLGGSLEGPEYRLVQKVESIEAHVVPAGHYEQPPQGAEYVAVPLIAEEQAGPGLIPHGKLLAWLLIHKCHGALYGQKDLIAVQLGPISTSMLPVLAPGDIVLVDRDDKDGDPPGRIMLVLDDAGCGMIRRLAVENGPDGKDLRLLYYADNALHTPPQVYSLKQDFYGDINRAVVGRVIWTWGDLRNR